jgi:hypothetical protein
MMAALVNTEQAPHVTISSELVDLQIFCMSWIRSKGAFEAVPMAHWSDLPTCNMVADSATCKVSEQPVLKVTTREAA